MEEFTVKVKDTVQDCTHTVHQIANNQTEANSIVLEWLRKVLKHDKFIIV